MKNWDSLKARLRFLFSEMLVRVERAWATALKRFARWCGTAEGLDSRSVQTFNSASVNKLVSETTILNRDEDITEIRMGRFWPARDSREGDEQQIMGLGGVEEVWRFHAGSWQRAR